MKSFTSSSGIVGFFFFISRIFLVSMARSNGVGSDCRGRSKTPGGGGKWRVRFLPLLAFLCILVSLWLFFEAGKDGIFIRKEKSIWILWEEKVQLLEELFNLKFQAMDKQFLSSVQDFVSILNSEISAKFGQEHKQSLCNFWIVCFMLIAMALISKVILSHIKFSCPSNNLVHKKQHEPPNPKSRGRWRKRILLLGILLGISISVWIYSSMNASIVARRKETLVNMCDERARMLQDQYNVSLNRVGALAILISTFHHGKTPSAINQKTFAEYTLRTAFERPLTSGIAYALKVMHFEREQFEKEQGWSIKKMETEDHSPVKDDYTAEELEPSPVQEEYAPVIFTHRTASHIVSVDMMSGKEDRDNILRASASGKGVLSSPFNLLKSNKPGVVLTFAVYKNDLPPFATPQDRIDATMGYLGASFDIASLVEKLLQQLASKQTIIVNVYDITNSLAPIIMYSPNVSGRGEVRICNVDFGDPMRKYSMHCRFKHGPLPPWSAITTSLGVAVIVLLVGYIFNAAINRIEKVEDDYHEIRELKVRAEAADVVKSQFLAIASHEIRTPMNGALGMLQMLLDTDLDATQRDFATTAQASGKSLISLINEVLDQAKIESGRLELEAVPFDIRAILDDVLSVFSHKSQAKGIELAVYVSNQVPQLIIGDPGRFRQIIAKLVGNSVKFTQEGHVFVSMHLIDEMKKNCDVGNHLFSRGQHPVENDTDLLHNTLSGFRVVDGCKSWECFKIFESRTEATDSVNILVTVEDTGVGIPQDAQKHIFMPFMEADNSALRTYGGISIGLNISKCLVDLMGGEIGFISETGVGSTFSFTIKFREGLRNSNDMERQLSETSVLDFQGIKGLVVDGRRIRADVAKYLLQRLGIEVEVATNPKFALTKVLNACRTGTAHFDIVLVDEDAWGDRSGLEFARPIAKLAQNCRIQALENIPKMLLLTTSLTPPDVDIKSAGYADSIRKPLCLNILIDCLQKALGVGNKRNLDAPGPPMLKSLLHGKRILVVDDNLVNLKVAAGALKKYGAIVTCAESGKVAIELLKPPHKFDACFMDVQMPEMDGFEATSRVRNLERNFNKLINSRDVDCHIPILAMTADVFQAGHDEYLRCGMDGCISKPFEVQQLYSSVAQFFRSDSTTTIL